MSWKTYFSFLQVTTELTFISRERGVSLERQVQNLRSDKDQLQQQLRAAQGKGSSERRDLQKRLEYVKACYSKAESDLKHANGSSRSFKSQIARALN